MGQQASPFDRDQWPADKRGGSDPDRCPDCRRPTYVRKMRWDGHRWLRPNPSSATCSRCGTTWSLGPIVGHEDLLPSGLPAVLEMER